MVRHGQGAVTYTKDFAGQLLHRFFGFLTVLLVLLFVYQHGDSLGRQVLASSRKLFGEKGTRYTLHATTAVRATVNGMMLIGLGKGVLMGIGYAFAGLSNPAILGALTGIFAMIPYAAKLIFGACASGAGGRGTHGGRRRVVCVRYDSYSGCG